MKRIFKAICCTVAMAAMFSSCDPTGDSTPTLSASPSEVTFSAEGDTKNVAVTCSEGDWTFAGQPSWLTLTKNGDELQMTAQANDENSERTGTVTLSAGKSGFIIDVKQEKASKYPGYKELTVAEAFYTGTMYQSFIPDCEGGLANIALISSDERTIVAIEFFTEAFATVEEVELTAGTYTKGDDFADMSTFTLEGTPGTFIAGGSYVITDEEGDEEFVGGTRVEYTTGDATENTFCTAGSFIITLNEDGTYLIKTDLKDADGKDLKYYYEGAIEFVTEGAIFPNAGEIDPTEIVSASAIYNGITGGKTSMTLTLAAASGATTSVEYYYDSEIAFASLTDLSGTFMAPVDETPLNGNVVPGEMLDLGNGMSFPMGTFIMFQFGNYFVADGQSSLMILPGETEGTYTLMANLKSSDETHDGYLIMATNMSIELMDGTAEGDYED